MKFVFKYGLIGSIVLNTFLGMTQKQMSLDTLKRRLLNPYHDTIRIKILYTMALQLQFTDIDSAMNCVYRSILLSEKNEYNEGKSQAFNFIGTHKKKFGQFDSAIYYLNKSLMICEESNKKGDIAINLDGLGMVYYDKGNYSKALEFLFKALKINQEIGNKKGEAISLGNIGIVHQMNHEYALSLEYGNKAIAIDKELKNNESVSRHLMNIGNAYFRIGDILRNKGMKKEADESYNKALESIYVSNELIKKLNNKSALSKNTCVIGNIYYSRGDTVKALQYYLEALKLEEAERSLDGISRNLCNIGWVYYELKKYKLAEDFTKRAIVYADSISAKELLYNLYENLSLIYEDSGNYTLALYNYKEFIKRRDSIYNIDNSRRSTQAEMNFKFEQKEILVQQENARQKIIRNVFIGGFVLMFILAIVVLNGYRVKRRTNKYISIQKEMMDIKNKEITDSIQYAKRIQHSLLPTEKYIERNLNKLNKD